MKIIIPSSEGYDGVSTKDPDWHITKDSIRNTYGQRGPTESAALPPTAPIFLPLQKSLKRNTPIPAH